jgi:hypothetical protein
MPASNHLFQGYQPARACAYDCDACLSHWKARNVGTDGESSLLQIMDIVYEQDTLYHLLWPSFPLKSGWFSEQSQMVGLSSLRYATSAIADKVLHLLFQYWSYRAVPIIQQIFSGLDVLINSKAIGFRLVGRMQLPLPGLTKQSQLISGVL